MGVNFCFCILHFKWIDFLFVFLASVWCLLRLLWPYIVGRSDRLAPRVGGWGELWCRLAPRVSTVGVSAASSMVGTGHPSPQLPTIETEKKLPSRAAAAQIIFRKMKTFQKVHIIQMWLPSSEGQQKIKFIITSGKTTNNAMGSKPASVIIK